MNERYSYGIILSDGKAGKKMKQNCCYLDGDSSAGHQMP